MTKEIKRKVIGVPLTKSLQKEGGALIVKGFFTSDSRDEVGDTITRGATERAIPKYKQWGNLRYMHQPKPVGKVMRIGKEDGMEWNEVEIKVIDPQAVFEVENGLLQALSVGILIKYEDIDMMEDGGWLINDYELAEISLVDHPANYDARLDLDIISSNEFRDQARELGYIPALRSFGINSVGEMDMSRKKSSEQEVVEEKDITLSVEIAPTQEQPVDEQPADEQPVEESAIEEKEILAEEQPAEESVEKELEEVSPVEDLVEESPKEASSEDVLLSVVASISAVAESLSAVAEKLAGALELIGKSEDKGADVEEEKSQSEQEESHEDLHKRIKQLEEKVADLEKPVDRKGYVPVEDAPDGDAVNKESDSVVEKVAQEEVLDLKSALKKYLESHK